jgi:hypothetical protein
LGQKLAANPSASWILVLLQLAMAPRDATDADQLFPDRILTFLRQRLAAPRPSSPPRHSAITPLRRGRDGQLFIQHSRAERISRVSDAQCQLQRLRE